MSAYINDDSPEVEGVQLTFYSELGLKIEGFMGDAPEGFYVYRLPGGNQLFDSFDEVQSQINLDSMRLIDLITERLFGDSSVYYSLLQQAPVGLIEGGLNPDLSLDRDIFVSIANRYSFEEAYKLVYLQDFSYLIDGFVETYFQAIESLRMAFYLMVSINPIGVSSDGVYCITSSESRGTMREMESFVIRMYSALDMLSRILFELQHVPCHFASFRKIPLDKSTLYSSYRRRSPHAHDEGHIFNSSSSTLYLEDLRNEIVHNRALENTATCFVQLEEGAVKERFFYLPDSDNAGRMMKWKGRCRFYSQEKKANLCLPELYRDISIRIARSLRCAIEELTDEVGGGGAKAMSAVTLTLRAQLRG